PGGCGWAPGRPEGSVEGTARRVPVGTGRAGHLRRLAAGDELDRAVRTGWRVGGARDRGGGGRLGDDDLVAAVDAVAPRPDELHPRVRGASPAAEEPAHTLVVLLEGGS